MRETARVLNCNYKTVYSKFLWLAKRAKDIHSKQVLSAETVFFDETESIEHTKLKPVTAPIAEIGRAHV